MSRPANGATNYSMAQVRKTTCIIWQKRWQSFGWMLDHMLSCWIVMWLGRIVCRVRFKGLSSVSRNPFTAETLFAPNINALAMTGGRAIVMVRSRGWFHQNGSGSEPARMKPLNGGPYYCWHQPCWAQCSVRALPLSIMTVIRVERKPQLGACIAVEAALWPDRGAWGKCRGHWAVIGVTVHPPPQQVPLLLRCLCMHIWQIPLAVLRSRQGNSTAPRQQKCMACPGHCIEILPGKDRSAMSTKALRAISTSELIQLFVALMQDHGTYAMRQQVDENPHDERLL